MSHTDRELAEFGAKLLTTLVMQEHWGAETFAAIGDIATASGFDLTDRRAARMICQRLDIDASNYGDTAPTVAFAKQHPLNTEIEDLVRSLHDARTRESTDDELELSELLIQTLYAANGITVTLY